MTDVQRDDGLDRARVVDQIAKSVNDYLRQYENSIALQATLAVRQCHVSNRPEVVGLVLKLPELVGAALNRGTSQSDHVTSSPSATAK
jgi:hypothetical protein